MSFFSSVTLFYPGMPPIITGEDWKQFATALRSEIGIDENSNCTLHLKWGEKIDQDYEDTTETDWDDSGLMGTFRDFPWDVEINDQPWDDLWREVPLNGENVYRSFLSLGSLSTEACRTLQAFDETIEGAYIVPDSASVSANPVYPMTLDAEEMVCTGMVGISFDGNGYFSWGRPFAAYAAQYRDSPPIISARKVSREFFPVGRNESFERITNHLGEIFLNREYYQEGDWILSIVETG